MSEKQKSSKSQMLSLYLSTRVLSENKMSVMRRTRKYNRGQIKMSENRMTSKSQMLSLNVL